MGDCRQIAPIEGNETKLIIKADQKSPFQTKDSSNGKMCPKGNLVGYNLQILHCKVHFPLLHTLNAFSKYSRRAL